MTDDDVRRTLAFFARWSVSFAELVAAFEEDMAPACVWEQKPLAVTTGPAEAIGFLRRAHRGMGLERIDVDTRHIAAGGAGVVHTERVDHLRRADGGLIVSAEVAGVLEWQDGKIVAWREHFDAASFVGRAVPGILTGVVRSLRPRA